MNDGLPLGRTLKLSTYLCRYWKPLYSNHLPWSVPLDIRSIFSILLLLRNYQEVKAQRKQQKQQAHDIHEMAGPRACRPADLPAA